MARFKSKPDRAARSFKLNGIITGTMACLAVVLGRSSAGTFQVREGSDRSLSNSCPVQ